MLALKIMGIKKNKNPFGRYYSSFGKVCARRQNVSFFIVVTNRIKTVSCHTALDKNLQ